MRRDPARPAYLIGWMRPAGAKRERGGARGRAGPDGEQR